MVQILANSVGTTGAEGDDKFGVPEKYCVIYGFTQINQLDDMNLMPKTWKKIKTYMDRQHPHFRKESKQMMHDIDDYKDQSGVAALCYKSNFVYKPSEEIM